MTELSANKVKQKFNESCAKCALANEENGKTSHQIRPKKNGRNKNGIKENQSNEMIYQIVIVKCVLACYHCSELVYFGNTFGICAFVVIIRKGRKGNIHHVHSNRM